MWNFKIVPFPEPIQQQCVEKRKDFEVDVCVILVVKQQERNRDATIFKCQNLIYIW